jgi:hypothetical protein
MGMAYELLRRIVASDLPLILTLRSDIETLRVLRDAGYVKAQIPPSREEPAVVVELTPLGRTALRYFGQG